MKMFEHKILMGIVAAAALTPFTAQATDLGGTSAAEIATVIGIVEDTTMDFGQIQVDAVSGTVTLTTVAGVTATNGAYLFSGAPAAGTFTATGDASAAVTISFSTGDTLTDQGGNGGAAMALGNFQHDGGGSPAIGVGGTLTFNVGADLTVGTSQVSSNYSGGYTVTVNYQ